MPRVYFNEDKCKGCGLCRDACPKKIIVISDKLNAKGYHPATVSKEDMKECIGCASCGRMCPDVVITVEK
ncbi:NAD(P)H-quinone oxidoreductase subunit I, chloroplastic [Oxobacter pfennigii]|uniref:NAD(P)H-quinone oxidoreductase subunit I, chloroplastic n=1 Tax=Oxobacter pfennigii TaxID=36849 RepID=A0A0P8WC51_9CLOT|nr:4Fe-4S binding protein [Oxobacter pfennigii]KPU46319.1 NAD(P)H-quinone oxidoreductase subunit I, chloroplastic [Oxobacter pfennigii]